MSESDEKDEKGATAAPRTSVVRALRPPPPHGAPPQVAQPSRSVEAPGTGPFTSPVEPPANDTNAPSGFTNLEFREFFDHNKDFHYGQARRILGSQTEAEDCVQEAFERGFRGRTSYSPARGTMKQWFCGIVMPDRLRRKPLGNRPGAPESG